MNAARVGRIELRDLELDLRADRHRARAPPVDEIRSPASSTASIRAAATIRLVEVDDDEQRLGREELEAAQPPRVVAGEAERAQRLAVLERVAARAAGSPVPS